MPSDEGLVILGIDPGINHVGWAVVRRTKTTPQLLNSGYINTTVIKMLSESDNSRQIEKISHIISQLRKDVSWDVVDQVVVEDPIVNMNPRTSLKLCKAQGAIIGLTIIQGKPIVQREATTVKKLLVGSGDADKHLMEVYIKRLFNLDSIPNQHVSDAIAIALAA